jgi:uncharacterized protein (DUF1697 family)
MTPSTKSTVRALAVATTIGSFALAALLGVAAEPERLVAAGRELHLWTPNGMAESVLAKELNRAKLGVIVTVRNWNTVVKLLGMVRPAG